MFPGSNKFTHWIRNTNEFLLVLGVCQYQLLGQFPFLHVSLDGKVLSPLSIGKNRQGFSCGCGLDHKGGLAPSLAEKMRFTLMFESSPISEARTRSQAVLSFNPTESFQKQAHLAALPVVHAGE